MNRKWLYGTIRALAFLSLSAPASAAPITLTFDTAMAEANTYTEAGMTITKAAASTSGVVIDGAGRWNVPCCPAPDYDEYNLTTGGLFDLLSIDILHSDGGDPIVFGGYLGAALVGVVAVDALNYGSLSFAGLGFTGLDRVHITVTGTWTDPTFDNLTYQVSVPEPATVALLGLGLVSIGFARRRQPRR